MYSAKMPCKPAAVKSIVQAFKSRKDHFHVVLILREYVKGGVGVIFSTRAVSS